MITNVLPMAPGTLVKFNGETIVWNPKLIGSMKERDIALILEANAKGQLWYRIISSKYTGWAVGTHIEKVQ